VIDSDVKVTRIATSGNLMADVVDPTSFHFSL
jgi:hypothetical protein